MHAPVHALLQQTPSTQLPKAHWFGSAGLHVAPFIFFATHVPPAPLQYVPPAQSVSVLHVLAHAPDVQRNGAQPCALALHAPPAHLPASWSVAVLVHVADEQVVPSAYFWHRPAPSHLPFVPQVVAPWSEQLPFGSVVPAAIGAQTPVPERLQAWHDPQLLLLQQTPSTQKPDVHWSPPPQVWPLAFVATHVPPTPVQYDPF
jgi:hypothetical protein